MYFQAVNAFRNIFQVHVRACFVAFALFVGLSFSSISQEVNPKVKALNEKAWEYLYADIDSAIYFANQAIQSAQKKDKYSLGAATCRLAVAYDINGDFEQALKYYLESLVYLKSYGASSELGFLYNNLSLCYYNFYDYKKALEYAKLSLNNGSKLQDSSAMASSLTNMGLFYGYLKDRVSALNSFDRAIEIAEQTKDTGTWHSALSNKAKLIFEEGKYSEAKAIYIELRPLISSNPAMVTWEISMSQVLSAQGNKSDALAHATNALEISRKFGLRERTLYALENLADVSEASGDSDKALTFYKEFLALKDSVFSEQMDERVANEETRFQLLEKEKEASDAKNKALEEKVRNDEFFQYIIIISIALLALVVFVFFLIYYLRLQRKANALAKNKLEQKELFMHEIHHRVKNNLQMIGAMIDIQSGEEMDEETAVFFEQMKERIQTIANTHKFLYENHRFQAVELQPYFDEFALLFEQHLQEKSIVFEKRIGVKQLHVDSLLPISLILSEWITNSLKYAFEGRAEGRIMLNLTEITEGLELRYEDDGIGIQNKSEGYGSIMVRSLTRQLKGKIDYLENGYSLVITRIKAIDED